MSDQTPKPPISNKKKYGLLALAAVLLIGAFIIGRFIDINPTYDHTTQAAEAHKEINIVGEKVILGDLKSLPSDNPIGDLSDNPVITLIEYGSLTCPHCAEFHENALASIREDYINNARIKYIYRDYPLDGAALKAALLAKCDISKRTAFLDLLYKKQMQWTQGKTIQDIEKNLMTMGKTGGLSSEKITECLQDKVMIESILSVQQQSGEAFKIEATPTIIINDQKFTGGLKADKLKKILDHLLDSEKPTS